MTTNSTNTTGASVMGADLKTELAAYDELDSRLKQFVDSAPEKLSCIWILEQQRIRGVDALLKSGRNMLQQRYPGFKPL